METAQGIVFAATEDEKRKFLSRVYGWMGIALFLSAATAFVVARSYTLMSLLWGHNAIGFWVLAIAEIALVLVLSTTIHKMSLTLARVCFVLYSVINGATLSSIFFAFSMNTIGQAFLCAAALFAAMSLYGAKTKRSLASAGRYLMMGLIGLVIVGVVNLVITLITRQTVAWIEWLIDIASVVIFTGLAAYDSQKILRAAEYADSSDSFQKLAIYGALDMYLDFINLFLSILRILGRSKK